MIRSQTRATSKEKKRVMLIHKGANIGFQPRIRKGAFFEAAWRHGCRNFSVYNRTYISGSFSSPEEEYWSVVNDVALWPAMGERQVEISGPDAADFVQLLTPRDMSKCDVGQCKYALITDQNGGIVSDPIILRPAPDTYWLSTSDCDLELWAKGIAVHADMNVHIRDAEISVLQVQGPKSALLLAEMFGEQIHTLKYYRLLKAQFEGAELIISRTGWSGELGYEIYLADATKGDALFDTALEVGKKYNALPGCVSQIRRIESGILSWGVDMTPAENPFELGLGRLVEFDSGARFIGRAALEALSRQPPSRKLVGLLVDGERLAPNEDVWAISANDTSVGKLTSLAYSPRLERNIALGLIDADHSEVGFKLDVETWDGNRTCVVADLPFLTKRQTM